MRTVNHDNQCRKRNLSALEVHPIVVSVVGNKSIKGLKLDNLEVVEFSSTLHIIKSRISIN